ncbi:MAG: DUF4397 domain-containing protein [Gemmatimonadetes bacterium]|nr:DUF4397 domain-containing protein [Gemmatimonadota bacterium]
MKTRRTFLLAALALGGVACGEDDAGPILAPTPPIAFVRYVHIVPDTSSMDWRPIDAIENSPEALNLQFRANTPYRAMGAGARRLRIFPTSTNINVTSQIVVDTTITFTPNTYYTLIHIGLARPGQTPADRIWVIEDAIPASIASGQVALRVINAAVGLGSVDVESATAAAGPFTSLAAGVAYGTAGTYRTVPTGALVLRANTAGTTTNIAAAATAPAGVAAGGGLSAAGGSTIGGSALTAIVVPRSVAGSAAANFTAPGIIYLVDKAP